MNERSVFAAALDIADPAQRAAYLDAACGDDPQARRRLDELLAAENHLGNFLARPPVAGDATGNYEPLAERPGTVIGPYKLMEQIGEGGMGLVFVAEQQQPVRRKVALKVIKPGMDTREVVARFEAERQALALMDHPNIARVLDAGTTDSGRPYFVMELVKGVPITDYCDRNQLTPRERLELFISVCRAVQHAHTKGIIHRDLKPSNILVTLHDGTPVVKVIDFGVAKAIGQQLTERTVYTRFAQMIGTPLYMSPEQAEMSGLDVDTRSDIYSLSVLLYELLTGSTPFDGERLRKASFDELRRIIREEEPPRPSTRLSTLGATLTAVSARRKTEAARLPALVRGELDWIVMKGLEKDRNRRYETANALARDVERYLRDEPVEACPPSAGYRLRKFARKHRTLLATAAGFAAVLFLGAAVSSWQAVLATEAEGIALANEHKAQAHAAQAHKNEQEANQQRDKAQKEHDEVKALNDKLEATLKELKATQARLRGTLYAAHLNLAQNALADANVPRVLRLLELQLPGAGETDLRGFEWHYLQRLCHPDHLLPVKAPFFAGHATFSPDGKRLFTVQRAGTQGGNVDGKVVKKRVEPVLTAFDAQTGEQLFKHTLEGGGRVVVLSPDGKLVASAQDREKALKVWDVATGKELHSFDRGGAGGVPVFSPDGKLLASPSGKEVMLWEAGTGKSLTTLKGHSEGVINVAFSRGGQRLVSVSGKWDFDKNDYVSTEVKVWDVPAGKELGSFQDADGAWQVSFSPDGKRVLSAAGHARVCDAKTGKELFRLKGPGAGFSFVGFSPDGRLLVTAEATSRVPRLTLWDPQTGQMLAVLQGHATGIYQVAFSPDGKWLASRESGHVVLIWDLQTGQEVASLRGVGSPAVGDSIAFSPDGKRLAVSGWDPFALAAGGKGGPGIPGGTVQPNVKVWDWQSQKDLGHTALAGINVPGPYALGATYVAFSPDLKHVAGVALTAVTVWDARTGQEIATLKGLSDFIQCLAFSPDGDRVAAGSGPSSGTRDDKPVPGMVKVWDVKTGKELLSLQGHTHSIGRVAFSPDGQLLASTGVDSTVKVWDTQTGQELLTLAAKDQPNRFIHVSNVGVVFSPGGKRLAANGKIWEAKTGQQLVALKGLLRPPVAFSPDGKKLVSVAGQLTVWDAETGEQLFSLPFEGGNRLSVSSAAFSPDGKRLAVVADDRLTLLDVQTWQEVLSLKVPREAAAIIAFSPDGHHLARATISGTVTFWDATPLPEKR
jgi:WD40 repeat protein/serine/threonine protein kinase